MDQHLRKVTDEFITQRVSYYGKNDTEAVNSAFMVLRDSVESLRESLKDEQTSLLRACENAYSLADGESQRFYYMSGFNDAIRFLMGWSSDQ